MLLPRGSLFSAALLAAGLALGPGMAQAQTRTVNINDVTVTEGQQATFTVSLSSASNRRIRVNYATANGTAVAPGDYTSRSGRLEFAPGVTSLPVQITTINNTVAEPTETFQVRLSNPDRVSIGDGTGFGTILDNDGANQGDAQAPTAPANLTATGAGGSQINLAWSASTDNVGVTGYRVERCTGASCTTFGQIAAIGNVTTFNDTGLTSNTTYRYRVRAADAAGNLSGYSSIANGTTAGGAVGRPNVSINSTSRSVVAIPNSSVGQQPAPNSNNSITPATGTGTTAYQVLAVNDLGMHCGDLDTRVSSILPPFNVVHAVALQKGQRPVKLTEAQVEIRYSAAASTTDPILTRTSPNPVLDPSFTGVYKTNFWDIARTAYAPFYPAGFLGAHQPFGVDISLPVPDVERLYLGDGQLAVDQQDMPGLNAPYSAANTTGNVPQAFTQFVGTQPFFNTIKNAQGVGFGYTSQVNWFEAAGIPISTFDDAGRENAYPLMRVQAVSKVAIGATPANTVLATVDTVVPVSGEADCKACHGHPNDGGNGTGTGALGSNVAQSFDDPQEGQVPLPVSQEWAADVNILRLHDRKHATSLEARQPVVCQTCHYTPALDLAQFGPNTPEEAAHKSMSAVMHKSHGDLRSQPQFANLFPPMPGPVGRDVATAQNVLNETCYMCHPGRRVQCMRGAMGQAGVVCQDCHGNMSQVGTDFSRNVSPSNPGAFEVAADFYTNPNTPRVPWANEPGCGSCHTGDATNLGRPTAPAGQTYIPAADGIRLLQAYRTGDTKATPIVPTNKRFAENVVTAADNPAAVNNPKLYRVSTGHGGLFCESCHGSTHAEWASQPAATLANANDNKTPQQLQGHNGTIIECSTCHGTAYNNSNTLNGPHGMHPVGNQANIDFVDGGHEDVVGNGNACRTCHGATGQGTVLSRTKVQRIFPDAANRGFPGGIIPAGTPVTCTMCHGNEL